MKNIFFIIVRNDQKHQFNNNFSDPGWITPFESFFMIMNH